MLSVNFNRKKKIQYDLKISISVISYVGTNDSNNHRIMLRGHTQGREKTTLRVHTLASHGNEPSGCVCG